MKKLALLVLVISYLFAARYPIEFEYYYMDSCVKAGKLERKKQIEYCACTLYKIEKKYTLSEFLQNMQTNKEEFLKKLAKEIIPECIDKLAK